MLVHWVKVIWAKDGDFWTTQGWEIIFFRQNIGMFERLCTQTYAFAVFAIFLKHFTSMKLAKVEYKTTFVETLDISGCEIRWLWSLSDYLGWVFANIRQLFPSKNVLIFSIFHPHKTTFISLFPLCSRKCPISGYACHCSHFCCRYLKLLTHRNIIHTIVISYLSSDIRHVVYVHIS